MKLMILASSKHIAKCNNLDAQEWRIVIPSQYSDVWQTPTASVTVQVLKQHLSKFTHIYVENSNEKNVITAISTLDLQSFYECDFVNLHTIESIIENSRFFDKSDIVARITEQSIDNLYAGELSSAIKSHLVGENKHLYNGKNIKNLYKELAGFYITLPIVSALFHLVKAERAIQAYKPSELHRVYVEYIKDGIRFKAPYGSIYTHETLQERDDLINHLRNPKYKHKVTAYQSETKAVKPIYKPVTLAFLQSKMFYLYNFSTDTTISIAKKLFYAGLISDPLTSSEHISDEYSMQLNRMIREKYGNSYASSNIRDFAKNDTSKSAILPIQLGEEYQPANINTNQKFTNAISVKERESALKMYEFIFAITEWLQMKEAIYDVSTLKLEVDTRKFEIKARAMTDIYNPETGKQEAQTAWNSKHKNLCNALLSETNTQTFEESSMVIPKCSFNEVLTPIDIYSLTNRPKRPPRYGIGRFISEILSAKEIGTNDTFSVIMDSLIATGMVSIVNKMIHPSEKAMQVIAWFELYAPFLLKEESIIEYRNQINLVSQEKKMGSELVDEYEFILDEIITNSGYVSQELTPAQIQLAKNIVSKQKIQIDSPETFFNNYEKVRVLLDSYSQNIEANKTKVFKCPICCKHNVFTNNYINPETGVDQLYYACEQSECFQMFDEKIDNFFISHGKNFNQEERLEAIKNIASKQNLKSQGYKFTELTAKNLKKYDAKVIISTYIDKQQRQRYGLKIIF